MDDKMIERIISALEGIESSLQDISENIEDMAKNIDTINEKASDNEDYGAKDIVKALWEIRNEIIKKGAI